MTKVFHWGKTVDSEVPVTGVVTNNRVPWLGEEIDSGIDLEYEAAVARGEDTEDWDSSADTILIGKWRKDSEGLYEPDPAGEYAAIVGEIYTQVVYSTTVKRCALCSPCYPGQGDLESAGDFLAYNLPAELYHE